MRQIIGLAVAALCLLPLPTMALDCAADQRAFVHAEGETCIPKTPQRIVAVRHDSIATPLIDIGAPVIGTTFSNMEDGSTYVRGASDIFGQGFVDALDVAATGDGNVPNMELIVTLQPDLIILAGYQTDLLAQSQDVAPTIVIPNNLPFLEHLQMLADAAGLLGTYEQRLAAYREKIAAIKTLIPAPQTISISRLDISDTGLWYYPNWGAVDQVISDIGFARPAVQAQATDNMVDVSFERVSEFDADIVISSRALRFGQTAQGLVAQWDASVPLWRRLDGVQRGNHYWYDRDIWVGYTFKSLDVVADGLALLAADRLAE
jgi:iron complex transport system substrate-binding protein